MSARSVLKPASELPDGGKMDPLSIANVAVRECAVDWITATRKRSNEISQFNDIGYSLLQANSWSGEKVTPWNFEQFTGLKTLGVAVGECDDYTIIRLSGATAAAHWKRVLQESTNCSRLDLQVTVENVPDCDRFVMQQFKASLAHFRDHKNPPTLDFRWSNKTGHTAYYNARKSSRFGRIYNKHRESKLAHYEGCVRFENQLNGRAAKHAASRLLTSRSPEALMFGHVHAWFTERGCVIPDPPAERCLLSSPRSRSTALRRLRWLHAQVRGPIHELCGSGYHAEVLDALGLSDLKLLEQVERNRSEG